MSTKNFSILISASQDGDEDVENINLLSWDTVTFNLS